jgi:hypothetical protein
VYLVGLKNDNKVPGFLKGEHGTLNYFLKSTDLDSTFPITRLFTATKQGDSSTYHYSVFRASLESGWKLQRAWRTSPDGKVAEEYPIP